MKQELFDYNDISFEKLTLDMSLEGLDDESLLEECNFILNGKYQSRMMDEVLTKYFKTGLISKEDRKKAEGLYLLAHGELAWEV